MRNGAVFKEALLPFVGQFLGIGQQLVRLDEV